VAILSSHRQSTKRCSGSRWRSSRRTSTRSATSSRKRGSGRGRENDGA
jgi:hypothetical protein